MLLVDKKSVYPPILPTTQRIFKEFKEVGFNDKHFSVIASKALDQINDNGAFAASRVGDWCNSFKELPKQFQGHETLGPQFGDPPITIFYSDHFIVDIYYWLTPVLDIHDHGFCGAFKVIEGETMQIEYEFTEKERWDDNFIDGSLSIKNLSLINPTSSAIPIIHGNKFIHTTVHLAKPTISLCVRTLSCNAYQYGYHPAGLALARPIHTVHNLNIKLISLLNIYGEDHLYKWLSPIVCSKTPQEIFEIIYCFYGVTNNYKLTLKLSENIHNDSLSAMIKRCITRDNTQRTTNEKLARKSRDEIIASILLDNFDPKQALRILSSIMSDKNNINKIATLMENMG